MAAQIRIQRNPPDPSASQPDPKSASQSAQPNHEQVRLGQKQLEEAGSLGSRRPIERTRAPERYQTVNILVNGQTYREMGLEMNILETDDLVSRESIPGIDILR